VFVQQTIVLVNLMTFSVALGIVEQRHHTWVSVRWSVKLVMTPPMTPKLCVIRELGLVLRLVSVCVCCASVALSPIRLFVCWNWL